jgi:hypothetical protein
MGVQINQRAVLVAVLLVTGSASIAAVFSDVAVKKSRAGICHARETSGYEQTKHFKPFESIQACLKSEGRLPKTFTSKKSRFDSSKPAHAGDDGVSSVHWSKSSMAILWS